MTRRSFIKSAILAAIGPAILVPAFPDTHKWKATKQGLVVPNPEWVNAEYEVLWLTPEGIFNVSEKGVQYVQDLPEGAIWKKVGPPIRLKAPQLLNQNVIPPFIRI